MADADYTDLVAGQREYFRSGATRPVEWRRQQLEALKALLEENRARFSPRSIKISGGTTPTPI